METEFSRLIILTFALLLQSWELVAKDPTSCGKLKFHPSRIGNTQNILVPWAAIVVESDELGNEIKHFAGQIITPTLIKSSSPHNSLKIHHFKNYYGILGATQEVVQVYPISHISTHLKYFLGNLTNTEIMFHLQEPVDISEQLQPICIPSLAEPFNQAEILDGVSQSFLLTGQQKDGTVQVYQNLTIQPQSECERRWNNLDTRSRFCATVNQDNAPISCIWEDFGPSKNINGTFYLLGQRDKYIRTNQSELCLPDATYYFQYWNNDTLTWIRNIDRCGLKNFTCSSGHCIPLQRLCNRVVDCVDGSDEIPEFCQNLFKCDDDQFFCPGDPNSFPVKDVCISMKKVQDGNLDCEDGEDELFFNSTSQISELFPLAQTVALEGLNPYLTGFFAATATLFLATVYFVRKRLEGRSIAKRYAKSTSSKEFRTYPWINPEVNLWKELPFHGFFLGEPWKSNQSLICLLEIDHGAFGTVYSAEDPTDLVNPKCAVKCCDISYNLNYGRQIATVNSATMNLLNEIEVLSNLNSDHVVRYINCWGEDGGNGYHVFDKEMLQACVQSRLREDEPSSAVINKPGVKSIGSPMRTIFIKMELCHFTMKQLLMSQQKTRLGNGHFISIAGDVVDGLKYIHEKRYIHRDIKPGNIFCKTDTIEGSVWKIGDLGLAVRVSDNPKRNTGQAGTKSYYSPEMRRNGNYGTKTDMYSLGLVFLEMVQSVGDNSEKLLKLDQSKRMKYLKRVIPQEFSCWVGVINSLLETNPNQRFGCEELEKALSKLKI